MFEAQTIWTCPLKDAIWILNRCGDLPNGFERPDQMLIEVLHHWRYVLNCTPVRSNGGVANFYEKDSQGPGEATLVVMSWSLAGKEIIRATQRNRFKRTYMVATVLGSHRCTGFSEWILCSSIIPTEQILAPKQLLSVRKNCSLIPNCPTPESFVAGRHHADGILQSLHGWQRNRNLAVTFRGVVVTREYCNCWPDAFAFRLGSGIGSDFAVMEIWYHIQSMQRTPLGET